MEGAEKGLATQKRFICNNSSLLDHEAKLAILALVELSHEEGGAELQGVLVDAAAGASVNLDRLGESRPDIVRHIYHIVAARRAALCSAYRAAPEA